MGRKPARWCVVVAGWGKNRRGGWLILDIKRLLLEHQNFSSFSLDVDEISPYTSFFWLYSYRLSYGCNYYAMIKYILITGPQLSVPLLLSFLSVFLPSFPSFLPSLAHSSLLPSIILSIYFSPSLFAFLKVKLKRQQRGVGIKLNLWMI